MLSIQKVICTQFLLKLFREHPNNQITLSRLIKKALVYPFNAISFCFLAILHQILSTFSYFLLFLLKKRHQFLDILRIPLILAFNCFHKFSIGLQIIGFCIRLWIIRFYIGLWYRLCADHSETPVLFVSNYVFIKLNHFPV